VSELAIAVYAARATFAQTMFASSDHMRSKYLFASRPIVLCLHRLAVPRLIALRLFALHPIAQELIAPRLTARGLSALCSVAWA
jgi:hypothetical protein